MQREQMAVALKNQKTLAINCYSMLRRLGQDEGPALEAQGEVETLLDELARVNVGEKDKKDFSIMNNAVGTQLRAAMINFVRQMLAKSEGARQYTLSTTVSKQQKEAEDLVEQLSEQLALPHMGILELVEQQDARPSTSDDEEENDIAKDANVVNAPHRGRRSAAGQVALALHDSGAKTDVKRGRGRPKGSKTKHSNKK